MHKLLARQLRHCFGAEVPDAVRSFATEVDSTYEEADKDRLFLEHSMDTVSRELTERNRRALEAVAILEATIESSADGVLVVDRSGRMIRMNHRFAELWRIPEHVLEARDDKAALTFVLDQLEHPDEFLRKVEQLYADPEAGSFDTLKFRDQRVFERYSTPLRVNGVTTGRVWLFRDATARLELEGQLRQSQKMEAIGLLAGGVAHDFNNILTVIGGNLEVLARDDAIAAKHADDLHAMSLATTRAATVTRQLLTFGRKGILRPVLLDLNVVMHDLAPVLARLIGEDLKLEPSASSRPAMVTADRGQIEQVLINLVINARDAMPQGGRLRVAVTHVALGDDSRTQARGGVPGPHVLLSVRDSGLGIAPEDLGRIFEPFFTTKEPGKGTGLGLSTVYGIVRQSGGFIEVHSVVNEGTTFDLYFPSAQAAETALEAAAPPAVAKHPSAAAKGETILVVEDEDAVGRVVRRTLERQGYAVLEAKTGRAALALVLDHSGPIHLVVTDVVMPEMSGPQFVQHLQIARPSVPVLFLSGYADTDIVRRGGVQSEAAFLEKPFTSDQLCSAVRAALTQVVPARGESQARRATGGR